MTAAENKVRQLRPREKTSKHSLAKTRPFGLSVKKRVRGKMARISRRRNWRRTA